MPNRASLLGQLKTLVDAIDDCCGPCCPAPPCGPCPPCCPPNGNSNNDKEDDDFTKRPFAQVCFSCPPHGPLPTVPQPVKPLCMPCLKGQPPTPEQMAQKERETNPGSRYDNFYNNFNVDYHQQAMSDEKGTPPRTGHEGPCGRDGKRPCADYKKIKIEPRTHYDSGCPTGFKPCQMRLCPPPCCNPIGVWRAQVMPCPPGGKKDISVPNLLPPPECCTRPGCKHWKPPGGPCLYEAPCRAHCFNHPPGMKPSGRACCTLPPSMCPD
ncbi:DBF4-type zinc finger-containing protein 2 homolog [Onthophagus taurus]|uniref:DBF4-type zinc finger-containing protein 2 homolog n=1 Tax=Onthophagus taurus TaxID=166361 RepID=UPI000C20D65E|nr:uncharacterized protein LOC111420821 [Onthophagus taurus]